MVKGFIVETAHGKGFHNDVSSPGKGSILTLTGKGYI